MCSQTARGGGVVEWGCPLLWAGLWAPRGPGPALGPGSRPCCVSRAPRLTSLGFSLVLAILSSWILIHREHAGARHIAAACRRGRPCPPPLPLTTAQGGWRRVPGRGLDPQAPPVHAGGQLLAPRLLSVSRSLLSPPGDKGCPGGERTHTARRSGRGSGSEPPLVRVIPGRLFLHDGLGRPVEAAHVGLFRVSGRRRDVLSGHSALRPRAAHPAPAPAWPPHPSLSPRQSLFRAETVPPPHPSIGIGSPSCSLGMSPSLGNPKTALTLRPASEACPAGLVGTPAFCGQGGACE